MDVVFAGVFGVVAETVDDEVRVDLTYRDVVSDEKGNSGSIEGFCDWEEEEEEDGSMCVYCLEERLGEGLIQLEL